MNKKWYQTSLIKAILVILEHLAVLGLAFCMLGFFILADHHIYPSDLGKNDYIQTEQFSVDVYAATYHILNNLGSKISWQALSRTDKDTIIDVSAASDIFYLDLGSNNELYTNVSGFAYPLHDLLDWSQKRNISSENVSQKNIVCQKSGQVGGYDYYLLEEFEKLLNDGELSPVIYSGSHNQAIRSLLNNLEICDYTSMEENSIYALEDRKGITQYVDFWTYNSNIIEELYPPIGYDSILDMVNTNPNWNGKLSDAYRQLGALLDSLSLLHDRINVINNYSDGNTNFRYLLADLDNKKIYSNISGCTMTNYENEIEEIRKNSAYVISSPFQCEDNLSKKAFNFWDVMNENIALKNYAFALTLDTSYPVFDSIAKDAQNFSTYIGYLSYVWNGTAISALLFLICIVWLTLISGRRNGSDELHLLSFDRWYTEISAAIVIFPWLFGMGAWFETCESIGPNYMQLSIALLFAGVFTAAMFLFGYLSLVRRIKAGLFWKNSITRKFLFGTISFLKRLFQFGVRCTNHLNSVLKAGLGGGIFLLFQFILCGFIFEGMPIGLLLLCIIDGLAIIYLIRKAEGLGQIQTGLKRISDGEIQYKIPLLHLHGDQKTMAESINHISEGLDDAIESSLKNERTKTELITNVSHDIKTPLTSIINYVDLLKREKIEDEKIQGYLTIIDTKAHQLKVLTEDIVEASKASSGNLTLEMTELDFVEMIQQVMGEFQEKYNDKNLTMISSFPETPVILHIDGRRMWRVLENIFGNAEKYAMTGTRVYIDLVVHEEVAIFSLKNISAQALNISADELAERFIRGDISRNTEGSGLGLSIAKSLVELQGGTFQLYLDGDLFKVEIKFTRK